ncbi:hypothetical protein QQZ08_010308 [Neonectria magnoliae]|uniref:Uncharacterized protein n=1 Tax=Neonectria magnoliae TaxID=2732573 RepID=A0ABR1HJ88_9HYPO
MYLKPLALTYFQGGYSVPRLGDLMLRKHVTEPQTVDKQDIRRATTSHEIWRSSQISKAPSALPSSLSVLNGIIKRFISPSETTIRKQYSKDLQTSLTALVRDRSTHREPKQTTRTKNIACKAILARQTLHEHKDKIRASLSDRITGSA